MSVWDRQAGRYRRQVWLERGALRRLLDLLEPEPPDRLLDVATGPGVLLEELARRPDRPLKASGLDLSEAMLSRAASLPSTWSLERADARALPHEDGSFDLVTATYLLHVMEPSQRADVCSEIARVLRPGGRAGVITVAPPRTAPVRLMTAPIRWLAERSEGPLMGLRPLDPRPDLEAAGLREVERARSLAGYPSLCVVAVRPGR